MVIWIIRYVVKFPFHIHINQMHNYNKIGGGGGREQILKEIHALGYLLHIFTITPIAANEEFKWCHSRFLFNVFLKTPRATTMVCHNSPDCSQSEIDLFGI
jgi:hypothetical protein